MARIRGRKALEARLDKLERTVSAALAQRAPKPQDRASADALIRQQLAERLDAIKRGEEPPPSPPAEAVPGDVAAEAAKIRAELYRRGERIEDAERQQVVRDLEGWAATLRSLAEQIVVPHEREEPDKVTTPVTPISAARSHRPEEPMNLGLFSDAGGEEFVHPDSRAWVESEEARLKGQRRDTSWRPSPWRLE